jgi:hypothetical protein
MKNTNEWINWIEESISREYYRLYEHNYFSNIQIIGTGVFGKVYRACWKNSQYFALKSFFNIDNITAKEIVHEVLYINYIIIILIYIIHIYVLIKVYLYNIDILAQVST